MKFNTFGFAFFSMLFIISTLYSVIAAAEYSLCVSEGDECSWEVLQSDEILYLYKKGDIMNYELESIEDEGTRWLITITDNNMHCTIIFRLNKNPDFTDFLCLVPVEEYLEELEARYQDDLEIHADKCNLTIKGPGITTQVKTYDNLVKDYSYDATTGWLSYMKIAYSNGTVIFEISEKKESNGISNEDDDESIVSISGYETWVIIGFMSLTTLMISYKWLKNCIKH